MYVRTYWRTNWLTLRKTIRTLRRRVLKVSARNNSAPVPSFLRSFGRFFTSSFSHQIRISAKKLLVQAEQSLELDSIWVPESATRLWRFKRFVVTSHNPRLSHPATVPATYGRYSAIHALWLHATGLHGQTHCSPQCCAFLLVNLRPLPEIPALHASRLALVCYWNEITSHLLSIAEIHVALLSLSLPPFRVSFFLLPFWF